MRKNILDNIAAKKAREGKKDTQIEKLIAVTEEVRKFIKEEYNLMTEIRVTAYGAEVLIRELGTGVIEDENDN